MECSEYSDRIYKMFGGLSIHEPCTVEPRWQSTAIVVVLMFLAGKTAATRGMEAKSVREQRVQLNGCKDGVYRV